MGMSTVVWGGKFHHWRYEYIPPSFHVFCIEYNVNSKTPSFLMYSLPFSTIYPIRCPTCFKGKLNLNEADAGLTILCKGYFNEEIQNRIPCQFTASATSAPRLPPWYSDEPTEEETEAMKAITEKHEALMDGGVSDVPPELVKAAAKLESSWDTSDRKHAAQTIVDLCTSGKTKVDLPQDEKKARMAIGKLILANMDVTCAEILELVVKEFGVASVKEEAKAKQKSAFAGSCNVAANAGIVQAFQELGDLYFKDGNSNAGLTVSVVSCEKVMLLVQ